ncbi:MAG: helicase C-terminal domain-containing protein [Promethearchaeota archaeon]
MINQQQDNASQSEESPKKIRGYSDFFPYGSFRPNQEKVIQQISEALALCKNTLLIATNGTGKTIMALSAAIPIVLNDPKRKILFCSRTFTQNARVIQETREITKKFAKNNINQTIGAISLRGRNEMCVHKTIQRLQLPPGESMTVCSSLRKNHRCKYFNNISKHRKTESFKETLNSLASQPMESQDLMNFAEQDDLCPYFLSKMLMEKEKVIVCNYQWIFHPSIREQFLENMKIELQDCIIIMDECHNLPEMANGINSVKITPFGLRGALKDLEAFQAKMNMRRFIRVLRDLLDGVKGRIEDETTLETNKFLRQILDKNKFSSTKELRLFLTDLKDYGEAIEKEKIDAGMVPRNHIKGVSEFFEIFLENYENPQFFACIRPNRSSRGKSISLEFKCLSPRLITDPIFKESFATLSLSGTLDPFTYTQLLGLNESGKMLKIVKMPPPFPPENVKVLMTSELSTRGELRTSTMYRKILRAIQPVVHYSYKNVGIFCASYEVLNGLLDNGIKELVKHSKKKFYYEQPGLSSSENDALIENFKDFSKDLDSPGGVLLGVCGGRNSEGEDFPGDYMNAVVIVGIPFQRPTPSGNAKIKYYDLLFPGKGRLFGYQIPAMNRSNQACGRPIRRMEDRGLIILMDYRFEIYKKYLSNWIQKEMRKIPNDPGLIAAEVQDFFKESFKQQ